MITQEDIDGLEDDVINARDAVVDACVELHFEEIRCLESALKYKREGKLGFNAEWLKRNDESVHRARRSVSDATAEFMRLSDKLGSARLEIVPLPQAAKKKRAKR